MKIKEKKYYLLFWRLLTYIWAILTALFFILDFFKIANCFHSLKTLTIIYISILSIFTSIKEFHRWHKKNFFSKYKGEIFVVAYTILMIGFIILETLNPNKYHIREEFTTTYLSILGIFAISYNSKYLKNK